MSFCSPKMAVVWWGTRELAVQREKGSRTSDEHLQPEEMTVAILEKPHPPQVTGCFLIQSLGRKLLFVQPGLGNLEEALQSGSYCVGQAVQGEN